MKQFNQFLQRYEPEIVEWLVSAALFVLMLCLILYNHWRLDRWMLELFGGAPVWRGITTSLSGYGIVHLPTLLSTSFLMAAGAMANPVANMVIDGLKALVISQRMKNLEAYATDTIPTDDDVATQ